jgi:hypothetical protein
MGASRWSVTSTCLTLNRPIRVSNDGEIYECTYREALEKSH